MKKRSAAKKSDNSSQRAETQRQNRMRKPTTKVDRGWNQYLPTYAEIVALANKSEKPFEYAETKRQIGKRGKK